MSKSELFFSGSALNLFHAVEDRVSLWVVGCGLFDLRHLFPRKVKFCHNISFKLSYFNAFVLDYSS